LSRAWLYNEVMKKVLMIDDNEELLDLMKFEYKKAGFDFLGLSYPPSNLLGRIHDYQPDIISMDVTMPHMDGFTAAKIIKADLKTKNIPLFFYTNMGREINVESGKDLGAVAYFVKTQTSPGEVVNWVKKFLD
jgi:CheY-like chemotaxis protein